MELAKDTIGIIGCLALMVLVFAGVRVYLAAALVGLVGVVADHRLEGGRGHRRHHPALQVGQLHAVGAAAVHPDRLSRLSRRHHAVAVRCGEEMDGMDAGRARRRHRVRGGGVLGGVGRLDRGGRRVRARGDPRDAEGRLRQAPGGRRGLRRRHPRRAHSAVGGHGGLCHHRRGLRGQADHRRVHSRADLGALLHADHRRLEPVEARRGPADHRLHLGRALALGARHACPCSA